MTDNTLILTLSRKQVLAQTYQSVRTSEPKKLQQGRPAALLFLLDLCWTAA